MGNHKSPFLELIINLWVSVAPWGILVVGDSRANNTFALEVSALAESFESVWDNSKRVGLKEPAWMQSWKLLPSFWGFWPGWWLGSPFQIDTGRFRQWTVMSSPHQPSMKTCGCPAQPTRQGFTTAGIFLLCLHLMVCGLEISIFRRMAAWIKILTNNTYSGFEMWRRIQFFNLPFTPGEKQLQ